MVLDCIAPQQIIMVEPEPAAFSILRQKFASDRRVQLHNVAVGSADGLANFNITRDTTGASLLKPREEMRALIGSNWTVTSEITVPVTTIDRLLVDIAGICLLKIDVQGSEQHVLAGAQQTLARTRFLLIELNYMPQYEGGSWLGVVHEILTKNFGFFLANASAAQVLNGRASMCDGLYVNPKLVSEWVKPDFV
jgi:FkbM family methyltransferase